MNTPRDPYALESSPFFRLTSIHELAKLLRLTVGQLRQECLQPAFAPMRVVRKPGPRSKTRNVSPPLKTTLLLHQRLLRFFDRVRRPPYLHSATRRRSHVTNAAAHSGQRHLVKADLRKFYESTTYSHVVAFFHHELQMAGDLARLLARLCTREGRLAMGSPLSPLLSFWVHKKMFDRLDALSRQHRLRFTAYFDDLTISGNRITESFFQTIRRSVAIQGLELKEQRASVVRVQAGVEVTGAWLSRGALFVPQPAYLLARQAIAAVSSAEADELATAIRTAEGHVSASSAIRRGAGKALNRLMARAIHAKKPL